MSHQSVNLRVGLPQGFGDDESRQRYEAECQRIRRTMRGHRFQVAPRASITTAAGRVIGPNEPVSLADFHGWPEPAWTLLARAVDECRVLEAEST